MAEETLPQLNENQSIDQFNLATSIAGAKILGVSINGDTNLFAINDIKGDYKGLAVASTNPGSPALAQVYDAKPGVTYPNFKDINNVPITIPASIAGNPVLSAKLIFNGSNWIADYTSSAIDLADYTKIVDVAEYVGKVKGVKSETAPNITLDMNYTSGMYLDGSGIPTVGGGFNYSQFLPIKPNEEYYCSYKGFANTVFFYNPSQSLIGKVGGGEPNELGNFTTPTNSAFIRINVENAQLTGRTIRISTGIQRVGYVASTNKNLNTFQGASNTVISALLNAKPRAIIAFIGFFSKDKSGKNLTAPLIVTQKAIADYWNAPFLDLSTKMNVINRDGVNTFTNVIPDGLHPGTDTSGKTVDRITDLCADFLRPLIADWSGKRIAWYGTSIPAGYPDPSTMAYPQKVAAKLGAGVDNYAVNGSMMRKNKSDGTPITGKSSFADTTQSINYMNKMVDLIGTPSESDIYVFDFGVNDFDEDNTEFLELY